ncbi:MAG: REP-associated tyrosine transposase [Candidatus Kerfeldbacteria bacterium]|jgi:REP-associated tyrosine transposase
MNLPRFNEVSYAHFITTKTFENKKIFSDKNCCEILVSDIDFYSGKLGFQLIGYCIMPDHLHLIIWWDVEGNNDLNISKVMHRIKGLSAQNLSRYLLGSRGVSASTESQGTKALSTLSKKHVMKIWQPSFYDFNIYSDNKLNEKLNYIHYNPVRAGLCAEPEDWIWSSYSYYKFGKQGKININNITK